jgi:hypothetical protein
MSGLGAFLPKTAPDQIGDLIHYLINDKENQNTRQIITALLASCFAFASTVPAQR